jgi:K+-sensing histidine kinase KdpD
LSLRWSLPWQRPWFAPRSTGSWDHSQLVTYFLAVVTVAWEEGAQTGLFTTAFGAIVGNYFFLAPRYELGVQTRDALFQTVLFVLVSGSIVAFSHVRLRQNARITRLLGEVRTREQELRMEIEARRAIEAAQRQLASIVTSSGDAIISCDLDGRIASCTRCRRKES